MYKVRIKSDFSAAHRIYQGTKCEQLHGHNWQVEICVNSEKLNEGQMVIDFGKLKQKLSKILENLDHKYLNEILSFSPTSENLARYIFEQIGKDFKKENCWLSSVSVRENKDTEATYCKP